MQTQRSFAVLLAALMLAVGLPLYIAAAQTDSDLELELLPGEIWERGDGLGYNISLNLGKNGQYVARWVGCLGQYGHSEGMWNEVEGGIDLKPAREQGMMQGHLRHLRRVALSGEVRLIPPEDIDNAKRFDRGGAFSTFYAFTLARLVEDTPSSNKTTEPLR
ncbi:hypothetical protein [Steroidobacter cummioxidans]|uniref:hypothetical protein n=1 Tax=Steroidobacter cummioxidans TaxID=1803913 RepID=UPI000E3161E4|nr:hypothetical protein [Steroidobacter cummioxidans]